MDDEVVVMVVVMEGGKEGVTGGFREGMEVIE